MRTRVLSMVLAAAAAAAAAACGSPGPSAGGDGKNDSFGGASAKSDSRFTDCQLSELMKVVNESASDADKLTGFGLKEEAAKAIVAHRLGADKKAGTGDDDLIDTLKELDDLDFVGPFALDVLAGAVLDRCEADLATRPFIDSKTFGGQSGGGFTRDNDEIESVMALKGLSGRRLHSLLTEKDNRGRTTFERLRKVRLMEAFSYEYGLDEMPWDSDSHAARESLPLIVLSIEDGRFEPNEDGEREISLGTDLMDDTYYDTPGYSLYRNDILLRGRARWDTPTEVRRLLVGVKLGTEVDAEGNKSAAKIDVRTDNGSTHVKTLDDDVRKGLSPWSSPAKPFEPIRAAWQFLVDKKALPKIGASENVLLLDPKVHLRSVRSRYHMNEADLSTLQTFFENGGEKIAAIVALAEKAKADGVVASGDRARVDAMLELARTAAALKLPDLSAEAQSRAALEQHRAAADAIDRAYHELAERIDDVDRIVTGAQDEDDAIWADRFRAWQVAKNKELAVKTVVDPHLTEWKRLAALPAADLQKELDAFNAHGDAQEKAGDEDFEDFEPVRAGSDAWKAMGAHLEEQAMTIWQRQIEGAGTMARALWFDQARRFYVPRSSRAFSNFMIDTMDFTEMVTHEEWLTIPEDKRNPANPIPPEKVFHTTLVNELQIELGMEKEYVTRLKDLAAKVAAPGATDEDRQLLEGARFVFGEYKNAMKVLTTLKGESVIRRLRQQGANMNISWEGTQDAKAQIALDLLSEVR